MNTRDARAACLAVGLATAWAAAAPASADTRTAQVEVNPATALSHVHFLYSANSSGYSLFASSRKLAGTISVGGTWSLRIPVDVGTDVWAWRYSQCTYSMAGIYDGDGDGDVDADDASAGSVAILLQPYEAEYVVDEQMSWGDEFYAATLEQVAAALWSDDDTALAQFMNSVYQWRFPSLGQTGYLVKFSGSAGPGAAGDAMASKLCMGASNRAVWDPLCEQVAGDYLNCLWGRLTSDGEYYFWLDDGSGKPVHVYCYDWQSLVSDGDYVSAVGDLSYYGGSPELWASTDTLTKLD